MFIRSKYNAFDNLTFTENHSFGIIPSKEKLASKSLIIIVQSRPDAFKARQTNRDTWIKRGRTICNIIFLC